MSFLSGFGFVFRGLHFIFIKHRHLAKYWLPPLLLGATLCIVLLGLWIAYGPDWLAAHWTLDASASTWTRGLRTSSLVIGFIVGLGLTVVTALLLTSLVTAPFNDALSEAVERIEAGLTPTPLTVGAMLKDALRSVIFEGCKIGAYVTLMVPLFIASWLIPVFGPAAYAVFGFLFTAFYFALDYTDWPMARRGWTLSARLAFVRRNLACMMGFGCGTWLLAWVPILNFFLLPAAVASGTLLFLSLELRSTGKTQGPLQRRCV